MNGALRETAVHRAAAAVAVLERYRPPNDLPADAVWPPRVTCLGWNGQPQPNAIHYSRRNTLSLMTSMIERGFCGGDLFISRTMSGLPNLLWEPLFERVTSVYPTAGSRPTQRDGKHTIHFGSIEDERFIHPVIAGLDNLRAVVLDDRRYAELCCGYFHARRVLRRPGIVVFVHADNRLPALEGVARFLADLAHGKLDNRPHDIVTVDEDPHGRGMAFEIIT